MSLQCVIDYILENKIFIFIFFILFFVQCIMKFMKGKMNSSTYQNLLDRIRSWWIIIISLFVALSDRRIFFIYLSFIMFLGLKEYFSIIDIRTEDRKLVFLMYLTIPFQTYFIYIKWYEVFVIFIPVYVFFLLSAMITLEQKTQGILKAGGTMFWGMMINVYSIGYIAYLYNLYPSSENTSIIGRNLVVYVLLLTESNDVFQYIWGKTFGKRKIIPAISPNKTWAGFIGGVISTGILSLIISPILFKNNFLISFLLGMGIAVLGFIGDIFISGIKRDLNLKDTSQLIPGHGGILDRMDSLIFVSPLFFHLIYYLYY